MKQKMLKSINFDVAILSFCLVAVALFFSACGKEKGLAEDFVKRDKQLIVNSSVARQQVENDAVEKLTPILVESYQIFSATGASLEDEELSSYLLSTGYITQSQYREAVQRGESLKELSRDEKMRKGEELLLWCFLLSKRCFQINSQP